MFVSSVFGWKTAVSVWHCQVAFNHKSLCDMSVTLEDPIKEVAELMESAKEEGWEKSQANKQVTFVVYREGDQLNFFRVVDRGDGTLTPLSESLRFENFFMNYKIHIHIFYYY